MGEIAEVPRERNAEFSQLGGGPTRGKLRGTKAFK